jgi:hypothetical protein
MPSRTPTVVPKNAGGASLNELRKVFILSV